MKIVYIAHNIAGDTDGNVQKVLAIVRAINLSMPHVVPFAPYIADVLALGEENPDHRFRGIRNDMEHIRRKNFDELWDFSDGHSNGVKMEINQCQLKGIPIFKCSLTEKNHVRFESKWKHILEDVHRDFYNIGNIIISKSKVQW